MHYDDDTLEDYLHGELGPERDAATHAHLETCAPCRTRFDQAAAVRDWLRTAARADEREFPSMIKARVWEMVRATGAPMSLADRLRSLWRPMIAVPVAAAIAAFAYLGLPGVHGAQPAGVAATYLLEEHAAVASDNPLADRGLIVPASIVDAQPMMAGDAANASAR